MTLEETVDLLMLAAGADRRNIGKSDSVTWHAIIGDLDFADAQAAVIAHYGETREFIMPSDVRSRVKAMRRDRLARGIMPAPDADPDSPVSYRASFAAMLKRMGDGFAVRLSIAGPVREGPPPQAFTDAKAAMPQPPTKQELAAQQAAESRAEREASARREADDAGDQ